MHGAQVVGHVLAHLPVAARSAAHEDAIAIGERDGQAVDLGLGDERERHVAEPVRLQQPAVAPVPGEQLLLVAGIGQREHGLHVAHLLELLQRLTAHTLCGRIGRAQLRETLLELLQLGEQAVVVGIADLRLVEHVVQLSMVLDLAAQRYRPPADLVGHTHGSTSASAWPCTHKDTIC